MAIYFLYYHLSSHQRSDDHVSIVIELNNLGSAYFKLGEKQKAKKYFQPAHVIFKQFLGPEHPNTKTVAQWLALCNE